MKPKHFNHFIRWAGSKERAAELLGISIHTVISIGLGRRRISRDVAVKAEEVSDGLFQRAVLMWDEPQDKECA